VDHQEHIKKQLSTRTLRNLRSASSAQGPYAEPVLRVCAGAQGGALTPRRTLERVRRLCLQRCCTPAHYRAVSDAQNRSLTPMGLALL
jgi:hypothetical protein